MNNTSEFYMKRCIELAKKGKPNAFPNPLVGSVIVCDNLIIGEGYHQQYGEAHAEVNAIRSVKDKELLNRSTIYVNLEPCAHFGKTPPCSDLIIEKKIPHVVIGCVDSFSKVAGKGIEKLKNAGVRVEVGVLEEEARRINRQFFTFHEKKRPYIILKWAKTKDGFIAPASHHDQNRWISNKQSQILVHKWRSEVGAILVGKNTVIKDNPSLTVREWHGKHPLRVVIDKELETTKKSFTIYHDGFPTIVFNHLKETSEGPIQYKKLTMEHSFPTQITKVLYNLGIQSLLVEGGTKTLQSFIDQDLFDEIRIIEGNKIFTAGVKEPNFSLNIAKKISIQEDTVRFYEHD